MDQKSRHKAIIERISKELQDEGFEVKGIFESSPQGPGDSNSYFDYLVDLKLEGRKIPSSQDLWEEFKKQLNHYQKIVIDADKEYNKVYTKVRGYEERIQELLAENIKLKKESKPVEE